jgi:hypothetical protein
MTTQPPDAAVLPDPETTKLALEAVKQAYEDDTERHRSIMSRTTSLVSLAGVLLSVYAAFVLRLLIETGVDSLDFVLALLTFVFLILGFAMGIAIFAPRRFERIDTGAIITEDFFKSPSADAAADLAEVYNRLLGINDRVLATMFGYFQLGAISVLAGLLLISIQGALLLAQKLP